MKLALASGLGGKMKNKETRQAFIDLYHEELAELNMPYTDEELEVHIKHRKWKSCIEMIHAHNWQLIMLALDWTSYLAGERKRPTRKICKYVNPSQGPDINNACTYIRELIDMMCKYGEGNCPRARINTYCSRSSNTLIDRLDRIKHSKHLTRAECAISKIFSYIAYEGEPRSTPEKYREKLLDLAKTFIGECTANAEELAEFTAMCIAKIEGKDFATIYEGSCRPLTKDEAIAMFENTKSAVKIDGSRTRKAIKGARAELKGDIYKAMQGSDFACHHKDPRKDAYVQKVVQYLARPGVTYSINDACCKIAGQTRPGHCKLSWLYLWCHRNEKLIRDAIEIIRAR